MYRGACTVQDWSNTTACPTQWCNDSKFSPETSFAFEWITRTKSLLVQTGGVSNIWHCPGINNTPSFYWCGDEGKVVACQKGSNVSNTQSAFPIPSPTILGFPSVDSTSSAPVAAPATVQHSTTVEHSTTEQHSTTVATPVTLISAAPATLSSTMAASTTASGPSEHSNQATQQTTAIGAGIGVPLGVAAIGFLVLLCWREIRRENMKKQQRQQHPRSGNDDAQGGFPLASKAFPRSGAELPDSQIPWELDHRAGIVEMPALSPSRTRS